MNAIRERKQRVIELQSGLVTRATAAIKKAERTLELKVHRQGLTYAY